MCKPFSWSCNNVSQGTHALLNGINIGAWKIFSHISQFKNSQSEEEYGINKLNPLLMNWLFYDAANILDFFIFFNWKGEYIKKNKSYKIDGLNTNPANKHISFGETLIQSPKYKHQPGEMISQYLEHWFTFFAPPEEQL